MVEGWLAFSAQQPCLLLATHETGENGLPWVHKSGLVPICSPLWLQCCAEHLSMHGGVPGCMRGQLLACRCPVRTWGDAMCGSTHSMSAGSAALPGVCAPRTTTPSPHHGASCLVPGTMSPALGHPRSFSSTRPGAGSHEGIGSICMLFHHAQQGRWDPPTAPRVDRCDRPQQCRRPSRTAGSSSWSRMLLWSAVPSTPPGVPFPAESSSGAGARQGC